MEAKTPFQKEVTSQYTDIQLCREFGWTPVDIAMLPQDFYNDCVLILNMEAAKQKAKLEEMKNKSKDRK